MKLSRNLGFAALGVVTLALPLAVRADGERIAVFTKNQTNPFFQIVRVGADNAAKQMNAVVVHYVPTKPDSIPEQMSQIEDVVVKKPDAIVFTPVDFKAMTPGIEKINAAGILVVNITDRASSGKFVAYVGAHDYNLGLETSRFLFKAMGGKGNVVLLEGVKGTLTNTERVRGFNDALKEFPGVKLVAAQPANYQRLAALQVMENLMQAQRDIGGVFAANDAMATGAIEALDGANRKALVVGINGTKEAVDAIKAGKMLATGDYSAFLHGCIGTMAAIRALRKQPVPTEVVFAARVVDKTNYQALDVPVEKRTCPKWEEVVK
jgi:ribose transport system substrate-binding protein